MDKPAMVNVITCLKWVKRGVSNSNPVKLKLTVDEIKQLIQDNIDYKKNLQKKFNKIDGGDGGCDMLEACMDKYDEDDSQPVLGLDEVATVGEDSATTSSYALNLNDNSDSEMEDEVIKPDDNLVLLGRVDNDFNSLEVWVYNEANQDLYIHHDLPLPSFPLCIEWLNHDATTGVDGNLCAVGGMNPAITIWDVDIMNSLEPAFKLGKKSKKTGQRIGHKDAVLDLAWNAEYEHILASGSADNTILLWDLDTCKPSTEITDATDRVQSLKWKLDDPHSLLSGSCDHFVRLYDCRYFDTFTSFKVKGEVEKVCWNPKNTSLFYVGNNKGKIYGFDIRNPEPLWHIKAHDEEITGLMAHSCFDDTLISCSMDGTIKYWNDAGPPELTFLRDPVVGKVQCCEYNPDSPNFIAVGGTDRSHNFRVMNLKPTPRIKAEPQEYQEESDEFQEESDELQAKLEEFSKSFKSDREVKVKKEPKYKHSFSRRA